LTQSLEQQTATSEVLGVISSSPGALQPVFDTMLSNAVRICEAKFGNLLLYEGDVFRFVAMYGAPTAFAELRRRNPVVPTGTVGTLARITATKQVQHVADITTEQPYLNRNPAALELADVAGARTLLAVPMLKDNDLIGGIGIYRQEVRPFSEKQIELVKNFASQAVIAIENTRLITELRESLRQQTATADVLKVISRATFDLPRVLDTLVESAATLCDSYDTAITQRDGDLLHIVSRRGHIPSVGAATGGTLPLTRGGAVGRAVLDRANDPPWRCAVGDGGISREQCDRPASWLPHHTSRPLIRAGEAIGAIVNRRTEVRPSSCSRPLPTRRSSSSRTRGCSRQSRPGRGSCRSRSRIRLRLP